MSEKIVIKGIKKGSNIQIEVSQSFYEFTKQVMLALVETQPNPQEFVKSTTDLKPEDERTLEQAYYEVLISIVATCERKAVEQGLIEDIEIDPSVLEGLEPNQDPS